MRSARIGISTTNFRIIPSAMRRIARKLNGREKRRNEKWVGVRIPTHFHKNQELTFDWDCGLNKRMHYRPCSIRLLTRFLIHGLSIGILNAQSS